MLVCLTPFDNLKPYKPGTLFKLRYFPFIGGYTLGMEAPLVQKLPAKELNVKWTYGFKKQARSEFPPMVIGLNSYLTM